MSNEVGGKIRSLRAALLLSAFVSPGAGQFAQRRWRAGLAYGITFLVVSLWLLGYLLLVFFYRLQAALRAAGDHHSPEELHFSVSYLLILASVAVLIYVLNLVDVCWAEKHSVALGKEGQSV